MKNFLLTSLILASFFVYSQTDKQTYFFKEEVKSSTIKHVYFTLDKQLSEEDLVSLNTDLALDDRIFGVKNYSGTTYYSSVDLSINIGDLQYYFSKYQTTIIPTNKTKSLKFKYYPHRPDINDDLLIKKWENEYPREFKAFTDIQFKLNESNHRSAK